MKKLHWKMALVALFAFCLARAYADEPATHPTPLQAMNVYLDGFHFKNGHMGQQMEAHHFCSAVNPDLIQCALFDGNDTKAHLIGIEYVISAKVFKTLPAEEKKLWHSHVYEVKSSQLAAPWMNNQDEYNLMKMVINTYGKTWHTWDTMANNLPLGIPTLMMGFTGPGQMNESLMMERDARFGISSESKISARAGIASPKIDPNADSWESGTVISLTEVKSHSKRFTKR